MTEQLRRGLGRQGPAARLEGEVEIDEVYVVAGHKGQPAAVAKRGVWAAPQAGGSAGPRHAGEGQATILGLIQRGGQVVLRMLADVRQKTIQPVIEATVAEGSLVHTDEYASTPACRPGATGTRRSAMPRGVRARRGRRRLLRDPRQHHGGDLVLAALLAPPAPGHLAEKLPLYLGFFEFVHNARAAAKPSRRPRRALVT
jgi:hypothetical protein